MGMIVSRAAPVPARKATERARIAPSRPIVARMEEGTVILSPQEYRDRLRKQREQITRPVLPMARDESAVQALNRALQEGVGPQPQIVGNLDDGDPGEESPLGGQPNTAEVALSFWDYDKNLLAKARLPRVMRSLYTRAITVGQHYNLPSILSYVYTDLVLTIPEDGKARKEVGAPYESLLRRDLTKVQPTAQGAPI